MARYDHDRERRYGGRPPSDRRNHEEGPGFGSGYRGPNYVGDFPDPAMDRYSRREHGEHAPRYPRDPSYDPYYPEFLEHPHIDHDSRPARPSRPAHRDRSGRDYRGGADADRGFAERAADEVASWFGDDEAEARRAADHRGKGPRGYRRSDSRIEEDINDKLTQDGRLDASGIEVTVSDGDVTLSGEVESKFAKRRAEDCADSVLGVGQVQNNIRVQAGRGDARPD
jgi:hypothetical protein